MKTYDLMGLEKNKSERPDRKILKRFFASHNLEFFKYLDKQVQHPLHLKQRLLSWIITDMEWPELDNPHDDLAHHLWSYYENKIDMMIEPSPDTSGMGEQQERIVLENHYENILSEIKYSLWYEIDMKIRHPDMYTESEKSDRKQKKHKKYIEARWPKFAETSGLSKILTAKEIAELMNFIEDTPGYWDEEPQFSDEKIINKLFQAWNCGKFDDHFPDTLDVLYNVYSLYSNWLDDRHWEEHGEPPI